MTRCVVYDIRSKNKLTRPLTPTIRNLYFISTTQLQCRRARSAKSSFVFQKGLFISLILNLLNLSVFLGEKKRIRIPLKREHNSLDAFKRHIVEHAGLKTETEKRGIGSSIDLKLCKLVKSAEGSKAFSINTQAQWNVERPLFVNSAVLQGECFYY